MTEISNGIARLYKTRLGQGPRRITTHLADDAVVCLLRGISTTTQHSLIEYGRIDLAHLLHDELQRNMAAEMRGVVERVLDRAVTSHVAGYDARADAATETFLLESQTKD
jgi:uncharacterized protein YbcI